MKALILGAALLVPGAAFAVPQVSAPPAAAAPATVPQRVVFPSVDEAGTELVGYLYAPVGVQGPAPAVVLMHGRAGAYSSLADGVYDAYNLSMRHRFCDE